MTEADFKRFVFRKTSAADGKIILDQIEKIEMKHSETARISAPVESLDARFAYREYFFVPTFHISDEEKPHDLSFFAAPAFIIAARRAFLFCRRKIKKLKIYQDCIKI